MGARIKHMMATNVDYDNRPNTTARTYKEAIQGFIAWCDDEDIKPRAIKADPAGIAQRYTDRLIAYGYSPATIHTRTAAVCRGLGISEAVLDRPKRTAGAITRSRRADVNAQGERELGNPKYARLVELQSAVGIRRAELGRLTGADLCRDESGQLCVRIAKGKGGKEQYQRILPMYRDVVMSIFEGVQSNSPIFSAAEMRNHIDLHGLRRSVAQQAYVYYSSLSAGARESLCKDLVARYAKYHGGDHSKAVQWLAKALKPGHGTYVLRGDNRQIAISKGMSIKLDRLAILATSVYHLSHWRLDVTVTNYLV